MYSQRKNEIKKMKWSSLKITMLPIIAIQVQYAIQLLNDYHSKISKDQATKEDVITFNQLFQGIQHEIKLLDTFYKNYQYDSTISLFHMLKIKLKKAIFGKNKISQNIKAKQSILQKQYNPSFNNSNWNHFDSTFLQDKPLFQNGQKQNIKSKQVKNSRHQDSFVNLYNNQHQLSDIETKKTGKSPLHMNENKFISTQQKQIFNKQKNTNSLKKNTSNTFSHKSPIKNKQQLSKDLNYNKQYKQISKNSTLKSIKQSNSQKQKKKQIKTKVQSVREKQQIVLKSEKNSKKHYGKTNKDSSEVLKNQSIYNKGNKNTVSQNLKEEQKQKNKLINQDNQFRFTIKMSRQQYQELLNMKKQLPK